MTKDPKPGDPVSWNSHGGTAHGKVVKKITSPTTDQDPQGRRVEGQSGVYRRDGRGETRGAQGGGVAAVVGFSAS